MRLVLPSRVLSECAREAAAFAPLESGGIFLGRFEVDGGRVVEHMIGPGPRAEHRRTWLEVDHEWQNDRIAAWSRTGAAAEYLGEWHSHPVATRGNLSGMDERTLVDLAAFEPLRCPDPVMMILFPGKDGWRHAAWHLEARRRDWFWSGRRSQSIDVRVTP